MISIVCPRCARRGSIPPDRINVRFLCPQCRVNFYMDASHRVHLGDPPVGDSQPTAGTSHGSRKVATAKKKNADLKAAKFDLAIETKWSELPLWTKIAVPLLAVGGVVVALMSMSSSPLPDAIDKRAQLVGSAFRHNDRGSLSRLCVSGTSGDAREWFDLVYPIVKSHMDPATLTATAIVSGVEGDESRVGLCLWSADPDLRVGASRHKTGAEPGALPTGSFQTTLVWDRDSSGHWWLNGSKTLDLAKKAESTDASGAGAEAK